MLIRVSYLTLLHATRQNKDGKNFINQRHDKRILKMFGMFGATKIKTEVFVETTYAFRQFTNIDLTKLAKNLI